MKAKAKNHKPVSAVITVPDPDDSPFIVHAEMGGTLQWRSDSINFPHFEIQFIGSNPTNNKENEKIEGGNFKASCNSPKKNGRLSLQDQSHQKGRHRKTIGTQRCPHSPMYRLR